MPERFRIFISSPGDVAEERVLANNLIRRLSEEFAGRLWIEPVFWEHEPLLATETFQSQIPPPRECEVAICILWSRLGTRLPASITRADGTRYSSGTEFEFEDAAAGFHQDGKPQLLVYRKKADPVVSLRDTTALMERVRQKESLDAFVKKWFFDAADGTIKAAYHSFQTAADFQLLLEEHLRKLIERRLAQIEHTDAVHARPAWTKGSPFRGLDVFEFEHAPIFFGRTRVIGEVLEALRTNAAAGRGFLLVVGVSGGGKSSLVRAGVLPLLVQPGVVEGVGLWRRAVLRPGAAGGGIFDSLAAALLEPNALPELASDGTTRAQLAEVLRRSPSGAFPLIKGGLSQASAMAAREQKLAGQPEARLVVFVDQLEELFTLPGLSTADREAFVGALSALARSGRVWVIATIRGDFYHRAFELPELVALQEGSGQYALPLPAPAELAQMVCQPARAAGLTFEKDPVTHVALDDVLRDAASASPEGLPLLEFALEELYRRRTPEGVLTFNAYHELGGVEGAVTRRAEAVFAALPPDVQMTFARVMRGMVSVGQREHVAGRQARLDEVAKTPQATAFVRAFVEARLFTADGGTGVDQLRAGAAMIRVTHEALLRTWPRAQQWLADNREMLAIRARVGGAAARWHAEARRPDLLLPTGRPLEEAVLLLTQWHDELSDGEVSFIERSTDRARRAQKWRRAAVGALAVLAVVASVAAYYANHQRGRANAAARVADEQRGEASRLGAAAVAARDALAKQVKAERTARSQFLADLARRKLDEGNVGAAVALARFAVPTNVPDWPRVGSAEDALSQALCAYSTGPVRPLVAFMGHAGTVRGALFAPDGKSTLTWSYDGTVRTWDLETGRPLKVLKHERAVRGAAFSADGKTILTWSFDGTARLWDAVSGAQVALLRHGDLVTGARFADHDSRVLTWSFDGTARVWRAPTGEPLAVVRHDGAVLGAILFGADESRLLTWSYDHTARVSDARTGAQLARVTHEDSVRGARLIDHDSRIVTWSHDKSARVWDAAGGKHFFRADHEHSVRGVDVDAAETHLLTWAQSAAHCWELASGAEVAVFKHDSTVLGAAFARDGKSVVTWSTDKTARAWDVESGKERYRSTYTDAVAGAVLSPKGERFLSWSYDGTARAVAGWQTDKPRPSTFKFDGPIRKAGSYDDAGKFAWAYSDDGTFRVWDADNGTGMATLRHDGEILNWDWSNAGGRSRMLTASADGTARLSEFFPPDRSVNLKDAGRVEGCLFSRRADALLTWSDDHTAGTWDAATGSARAVFRCADAVLGAAFSADDKVVVTWSKDRTITFWAADSGKQIERVAGAAGIAGVAVAPGGGALVAWFEDGTAGLWDAGTGARRSDLAAVAAARVRGAKFSGDGATVLLWCADATCGTFDARTGSPLRTFHTTRPAVSAATAFDGTRALTWPDDSTDGELWDLSVPRKIADVAMDDGGRGAVFSRDGARLLTWASGHAAHVRSAADGANLFTLVQQNGAVAGGMFLPDGTIATWASSSDGAVHLWHAGDGREIRQFRLDSGVQGLTLSADGRALATHAGSGSVVVWNWETGNPLARLSPGIVRRAVFTPDASRVAVCSENGVAIWPTRPVAGAADAVARLHPLSRADYQQAYLDPAGAPMPDRAAAVLGDEADFGQAAPAAPSTTPATRNALSATADNDVRLELAVNDRSEVFIFHNKPLTRKIVRLQAHRLSGMLQFVFDTGEAREFGIPVDPRLMRYMLMADRVLVVQMDDKTGKPLGGDYYPVVVY